MFHYNHSMMRPILSLLLLLLLQLPLLAQQQPAILQLTHHKTTSLVFPDAIQSVDRGSRDVLAQVPAGVSHILLVKAARPGIGETNLTVITATGQLYTIDVRYAAAPQNTQIFFPARPAGPGTPGTELSLAQVQTLSADLENDTRFYHGIGARAGRAQARLEGIYSYGNTLFFRVVLTNRSPIPYNLDFYRMSIRDRRQARRTVRQERELLPRHIHGLGKTSLAAGQGQVLVFALDKFTVARDKELVLEFFEQDGTRHLPLRIRGRHLLRACPVYLQP